ncbi:uncharacterized protein LOC115742027 isoform X2 [Rhodamnia argentea]|uniref:Uncharacterized protein LOC115742027 isoform X2 n=1 Tax=Rhodamnia argentea TaxID=178133 RepID=A0ABM3GS31_9MYRT|nr:uncharacterized protein LOC115742027 isoform X2 [Rhodamnia argentea]
MASDIPSKHEAFPRNRDRRSNSPVRKSLKPHQNSKKVNESERKPPRSNRIGHPDKSRVQSCQGQPTLKHVNDRVVQLKSTTDQKRQCGSGEMVKDDELVRHMTNLPDYLQRVETRRNLQGKALNFGVLDWSRLENFTRNCNTGTRTHRSEQRGSLGPCPSYCEMDGISRCVKPIASKVMRCQDVGSASKSILEGHEKINRAYRSSRKECSDGAVRKDNRNSLHQRTVSELGGSSDLQNSMFTVSPRKSNRTVSHGERNTRGNNREQKCMSVAGTSSSKLSINARSISLKEMITAENDENEKKVEKSLTRETSNKQSSRNKATIALLSTSKHPHTSSMDASHKSDTRKLFDRSLTDATRNYFSDALFAEELCSRELCSELPHSCPMSLKVDAQRETTRRGSELRNPNDSDDTRNSSKGEAIGSLNQEAVNSAGKKSRHPSPNHRFSLSFGRISRSFSFRESASAPLCSSASVTDRSGPMASEDFPCSGNLTKEQPDVASKGWSGIRRLLDPLLKSKSALSYRRSDSIQQSEQSSTSLSLSHECSTESLQIGNHDASALQALLQVSSVDGLPLFKFVVGKNSHIVAAATRDATLSGKSNSARNYTIYSVDETTKKSNSWIGHGSKMRSSGFVYNVVGQLTFRDACSDNCNEQTVEREYVLSGLGLSRADKESLDPPMNRELAAIIFKIPVDTPSNCKAQATSHKHLRDDLRGENCFSKLPNDNNNHLMVILPGGDHSVPSNGEPSSLIYRWRTGGSCDCGGWDVGCKLHILSPQKDFCETLRTPSVCSMSDNLELFAQGEAQQENAIFSLKLYTTGIYLVEFNPTISSLQAFAICLAVISCQTSSEPSDWRQLSKSRTLQGHSVSGNDVNLPNTTLHFEVPPIYPPYPPFSPLDRA